MKFKLVRVADGTEIPVTPSLLVGRLEECGLRLTQGLPSRRHAQVSVVDHRVWVEDLGSVNGTYINGTRIATKTPMQPGDRVRFDLEEFHLHAAPDAQSAPTMYRPLAQEIAGMQASGHPPTVRIEPPKIEAPKFEAPKFEATRVEPARIEPKIEPRIEAKVAVPQAPARAELTKVEPRRIDPVIVEPRKIEPQKIEPSIAPPAQNPAASGLNRKLEAPSSQSAAASGLHPKIALPQNAAASGPHPKIDPRAAQDAATSGVRPKLEPAAVHSAAASGRHPKLELPKEKAAQPEVVVERRKPPVDGPAKPEPGEASGLFKRPGAWADPDFDDGANKTKFMDPAALQGALAQRGAAPSSPVAVNAPCLVLLSGAARGTKIDLQTSVAEWTIGSGVECQVKLSDSGVSSLHAKLVNDGKRWKLIDQMSANGTYVNGKRSNVSYLSSGDRLGFGPVECEIRLPGGGRARIPEEATSVTKRNVLIAAAVVAVAVIGIAIWLLA